MIYIEIWYLFILPHTDKQTFFENLFKLNSKHSMGVEFKSSTYFFLYRIVLFNCVYVAPALITVHAVLMYYRFNLNYLDLYVRRTVQF